MRRIAQVRREPGSKSKIRSHLRQLGRLMTCFIMLAARQHVLDFLRQAAHYRVDGAAVEMGFAITNHPCFKQDRYCEGRESLIHIPHVGHCLPKARPVEKPVTLMNDHVVNLLVLKTPLLIGAQRIEDEEATTVFAGRIAYVAK